MRWGAGGERCAPGDARAGGADGGEDSQTQAGKCRGSALPARAGSGDARAGGRRRKRGRGTDHPLFTGGISLMNSGCRFVLDSYLVDPARSHMLVSKIKAGETSGRGGSAP